jgi:poly(hydroxyalkanoate) granule-associated protein
MPARGKRLNESATSARAKVRDAFSAAQESVQARLDTARVQAEETWDNIEALFQSRVQKAMTRLGIPGAEEFQQLAARVTEMRKELTALGRGRASAKKSGAPGATAGSKGRRTARKPRGSAHRKSSRARR